VSSSKHDFKPKLFPIFLVVLIDLIGFGIVLPLLPIYADTYGARPFTIGLLAVSYSLTQFLFSPFWGGVSDRIGRRPVLMLSLTGAVVFYVIFGWAPSLFWLFVARLGAGIFAANISTAMAYIADITTAETRTKGMGMIGVAFGVGFIIGPALGGFLSKFDMSWPGYGAAMLSAIALLLAFFSLPETRMKSKESFSSAKYLKSLGSSLRKHEIARPVMVSFLVIFAFSGMQLTFPLFTKAAFGYEGEQNGYLFALGGLVAVLFQGGLIGRLARIFGETKLAISGIFLNFIGFIILPFANSLLALIMLMTLMGAGSGLSSPTLTSLISLGTDDEQQGTVMGASRSVTTMARIVGPLWAGWAYGAVGLQWTYWISALLLCVAVFVIVPLLKIRLRPDNA
jgi:DHA1 family tetracycline resistance protein-like MFS transporter